MHGIKLNIQVRIEGLKWVEGLLENAWHHAVQLLGDKNCMMLQQYHVQRGNLQQAFAWRGVPFDFHIL